MFFARRCRSPILLGHKTTGLTFNLSLVRNNKHEAQTYSSTFNGKEPQQQILLGSGNMNELKKTNTASTIVAASNSMWRKMFDYMEEVSHLDVVRKAQGDVMSIKQKLHNVGNEKRKILEKLKIVRHEIEHVYKDMKFANNRISNQYLQLVKTELDLYTKEKELQDAYTSADEEEQYLFNKFSEAISDSYEKEKLHTNFLKVMGVVGTVITSLLTLSASIIGQMYHQNRSKMIRQDVEYSLSSQVHQKLTELNNRIKQIERQTQKNNTESWGSYLNRHTRWIYSWAIPNKK